MSTASRKLTRQERRREELEQRRTRRRERRHATRPRSMLLPLSLAALAIGVVAVVGFVLATAPPGTVELEPPAGSGDYRLADGQSLGEPNAPLTMEIYSDFQCPACGTLARTIEPALVRDYVNTGQLRLVYRDFAFLGPESVDAAIAGRCAAEQNRFWQYHDYLFANQRGENRGAFSADRLHAMAEATGLDLTAWQACIAQPSVRQAVLEARAQAAAIPINSTPTLVVEGQAPIVGVPDYAALRQLLDSLLDEADQ